MKNNGDNSGLLGICRKAGKLKLGMDMTKGACESGEAKAVFTASDISQKSLKEVKFSCVWADISRGASAFLPLSTGVAV